MRRIFAVHKIIGVARVARSLRSLEYVVDVACCARQRRVRSRQCIAGILQVVEFGVEPAVYRMARLASRRKFRGHMIEDRSQKIFLMARVAGGRETRKLPSCRVLVTVIALQQGVRTYQRKAILMIADLLERDLPPLNRMAILAIGAKLPAMNVSVAIGTVLAHVLEDQARMAFRALDFLVHSA
jgi:hypothetical protein